jgi:uncharacterized protein with NAD-binding domain and iron-sulfur cluster
MSSKGQTKVAIIGGGCASISTAFELSQPHHNGRFDITVYQQGWRLGGKGASGRGVDGRIEEHGLHLWMGHYDNAFQLMRQCYQELDRDPLNCPITEWTEAFIPDPLVGVADRDASGDWQLLMASFPPFEGTPGDPYPPGATFTVASYLTRAAQLLYTLILSAQSSSQEGGGATEAGVSTGNAESADELVGFMTRLLGYGEMATLTAVIQAVSVLEAVLDAVPIIPLQLVRRYLDAIHAAVQRLLQPILDGNSEHRFIWEIIDIVIATIRGAITSGLATDPRGFDAINDFDSREWLLLNGASERSVNSGFMRGLYDLALAYEDGDPERPAMAAGQGLRGTFRMLFTYRGSLFWKMQAGMGDIVFAPFYEVLKKRGVKFEFFHKLTNVGIGEDPADGSPHVNSLSFDVQAVMTEQAEYQPLVDVHGLPCWPSEPDWSQLDHGEQMRLDDWRFESFWESRLQRSKTLRVTDDFDFVVLGVGGGAVPYLCKEILARDVRWRIMVEQTRTVATQAFQVWLNEEMEELGWERPPPNISGFVEPFDTWADMSHLIEAENGPDELRSVAYFCSVLPSSEQSLDQNDDEYPDTQDEIVKRNAIRFLDRDIVHLWPKAQNKAKSFRWELLAASQQIDNGDRPATEHAFDTQFWTANVNPTDRYVLSVPGSLKHRISPLDATYDNLTIAGDWTDCGFNFGCVEAAVMSGRLAAHALSEQPALEDIFGYDHP